MLNYQKTSKHKAKCFENGTCWQSIATHDLTGNLVQFPLGTVHQKKQQIVLSLDYWPMEKMLLVIGTVYDWLHHITPFGSRIYDVFSVDASIHWGLPELNATAAYLNFSSTAGGQTCHRTGDKWLCCEFVFAETVDSYPLRPTCINNIQIVLYSSIRLLFSYILYKYSGESWLVPLNGKYSLRDLSDPHAKSLPRFLVFCSWSQTMQRIGGYGGVL